MKICLKSWLNMCLYMLNKTCAGIGPMGQPLEKKYSVKQTFLEENYSLWCGVKSLAQGYLSLEVEWNGLCLQNFRKTCEVILSSKKR